jgi:glycosyltransferase involved in cell wall biosynthesis
MKNCQIIEYNGNEKDLIGRKITKNRDKLKIALICNWGENCGIATYTQFLCKHLEQKAEIKVFSEKDGYWKRGHSMRHAILKIKEWNPDFILIQHEFGIFPKATHFLQMLSMLDNIPYAIVLHSVYEHLDKSVCTSMIRNIIVHTQEGKELLQSLGHKSNIYVVPHGCLKFSDIQENWNIFQTPYTIIQFGFGFFYKGVDVALEAVAYLKKTDEKFKDIFYCYLCSENSHCANVHNTYIDFLKDKIRDLDIEDNVSILLGFHEEKVINNYLRTAKLAIFPYVVDLNNNVRAASGAIRMAMANEIPVIASKSHLFDDLEGVVPRPEGYLSLAHQIDLVFSNEIYRKNIINNSRKFIDENSWEICSDKYLSAIEDIVKKENFASIEL